MLSHRNHVERTINRLEERTMRDKSTAKMVDVYRDQSFNNIKSVIYGAQPEESRIPAKATQEWGDGGQNRQAFDAAAQAGGAHAAGARSKVTHLQLGGDIVLQQPTAPRQPAPWDQPSNSERPSRYASKPQAGAPWARDDRKPVQRSAQQKAPWDHEEPIVKQGKRAHDQQHMWLQDFQASMAAPPAQTSDPAPSTSVATDRSRQTGMAHTSGDTGGDALDAFVREQQPQATQGAPTGCAGPAALPSSVNEWRQIYFDIKQGALEDIPKDADGMLELQPLVQLFIRAGVGAVLTSDSVSELLARCDISPDGFPTFPEFMDCMGLHTSLGKVTHGGGAEAVPVAARPQPTQYVKPALRPRSPPPPSSRQGLLELGPSV